MILDFLWQHSSLVRATSGSGWSATTQLLNLKVKRVLILDVWHSLNASCQSMWSVQDLFFAEFHEIPSSLLYKTMKWRCKYKIHTAPTHRPISCVPYIPSGRQLCMDPIWSWILKTRKEWERKIPIIKKMWHPRYGKTMMLICCLSGPKRQAKRKVWCLIHQLLMHWSLYKVQISSRDVSIRCGRRWMTSHVLGWGFRKYKAAQIWRY